MNHFPIKGLSPGQQQLLMEQIFTLLANQVKSYHKHRHMRESSSVPVELAQELMASTMYTLEIAGGISGSSSLEATLSMGQALLETRVQKAWDLLILVIATAPRWQTKSRREALRYLGRYLKGYDLLHLAHKGPSGLYYPIPVSVPEDLQGIDSGLYYLQILWRENQIMAGVDEPLQESFWDRLPSDVPNQCEQLVVNGIGKMLITTLPDSLLFSEEDHRTLFRLLEATTPEEQESLLASGANGFVRWLGLTNPNAIDYIMALVSPLSSRLNHGRQYLPEIFL